MNPCYICGSDFDTYHADNERGYGPVYVCHTGTCSAEYERIARDAYMAEYEQAAADLYDDYFGR